MESAAAVPSPSPAMDDAVRAPLPSMVMGDAAVATPREHEWPGRLFVALSYLGAVGLCIGALGGVMMMTSMGPGMLGETALRLLGGGIWGVLQWRLAGEVQRFSRWGWYGAMAELAGAAVLKLTAVVMIPPIAIVYGPMLAANALWMRYFWKRRAQFGVDLGG